MGRPKKNLQDAATTVEIALQNDPESLMCHGNIIHLFTERDVELYPGRVIMHFLKPRLPLGAVGVIVNTPENAQLGISAECGMRLTNSSVIPVVCDWNSPLAVTVLVNEDVNVVRSNEFGTMVKRVTIPKGTHIADVLIIA